MSVEKQLFEFDEDATLPDPDEIPIRDRKLTTQPYDLGVEALMEQIKAKTMFLRPLSERPNFQRRYVWPEILACRLIESILLNVPIPPCYLSQNEEYELDVIDGQQRLFSIYRFIENRFALNKLEVLTELNGLRFFELTSKLQRQLKTHTLRCVLITNDSHPEIKFDVFERLNTNTTPLNAQELRNCVYRGSLNSLLQELVSDNQWLEILRKRAPDKRMRDEELVLRFFAFFIHGVPSYRTPQKHWLNETAKQGMKYSDKRVEELRRVWSNALSVSLEWFAPQECFRRVPFKDHKTLNRALFDLVMNSATKMDVKDARSLRKEVRTRYEKLLRNREFADLISRAVDHKKRTTRRFDMWQDTFKVIF